MSSQFLDLTNRVLKAFNEVNLTSSTFASAAGFHAEAKDAVNQAIFDIYTFEDTEWPFAWSSITFDTTIGTRNYSKDTTFTSLDWDSFKIKRPVATMFTLTQTAGVATFTSVANHNLVTGDSVNIYGATPTGYNGDFIVTVTGATTFTFTVDSATTSPASGTITASSNTIAQKTLKFKDIDSYRDELYDDEDAGRNSNGWSRPDIVVRKSDNNLYISPVPDRVYTVYYEGFILPSPLSVYSDTSSIPTPFDQVIIDKALHYAYMFRDNLEQAALANSRYENNVNKMRRILIPQWHFVRFTD